MRNNWTREEIIVALNVYCKIPFKDSRASHPLVRAYAQLIGRTPAALNMKIGNLGRFDPMLRERGIVGLSQGSKLDEAVWNEFTDNPEALVYESERIIARYKSQPLEEATRIDTTDLPLGQEREAIVRQRVNQQFFRAAVLCAYGHRCCITGITQPSLIEACHISPWSEDVRNRTNPQNGLSMNPLFHKAFDDLLLTVTPDYTVMVSDQLVASTQDERFRAYLSTIQGSTIHLPEKFCPDRALLDQHHQRFLHNL